MSSRALVIAHRARPARSRSPRIAVTAVFVAHGLLFASWTAHIPHIMRHLGLSDGTLGIALLGAPVGSVAGAGIGALAVGAGLSLTPQLLILGTIALLGAGLLTSRMLPDAIARPGADERPKTDTLSASRWSGGMILLGAIAFAGMLCEGASADWASVYLSGPLHATGAVPGLGYAAFALAMVTVRLSGNRLLSRFGPARLLPVLAAAATAGFAAGLAIGRPAAAIAGFVFLGIGLASVIPAVFSAAGRIAGLHPGTAVATVSACGWTGFVCGPPLIGHLASLASLSLALGLLPFLTAFVAVGTLLSRALRDASQGPASPARSDGTP